MSLDIARIDKVELLKDLWELKSFAPHFLILDKRPMFDINKAKDVVNHSIYYFCGKFMNIDISRDTIDLTNCEHADILISVVQNLRIHYP